MKNHGERTNALSSYAKRGGGNLWCRSRKRKLRAFGISSPFILLSSSQNSITTTFSPCCPRSTVLLFSFLPSVQNLHHTCIIFFTGKFEIQSWFESAVFVYVGKSNGNGSAVQNGWCWGPDIHTTHVWGYKPRKNIAPLWTKPLNGDTVITSANSLVRLYPTLLRGERYHGWHPPHSILTTSRVSVRSQLRLNSLYCKWRKRCPWGILSIFNRWYSMKTALKIYCH